jgi:hypothetical protein
MMKKRFELKVGWGQAEARVVWVNLDLTIMMVMFTVCGTMAFVAYQSH